MRKKSKNDSVDFEKKFLDGHVDKVNRLSSRLYFILSFLCIILYIFCRVGFYNYPVNRALFIVVFAISSSTILLLYDRKFKNHKAKSLFKYLLLIATQQPKMAHNCHRLQKRCQMRSHFEVLDAQNLSCYRLFC